MRVSDELSVSSARSSAGAGLVRVRGDAGGAAAEGWRGRVARGVEGSGGGREELDGGPLDGGGTSTTMSVRVLCAFGGIASKRWCEATRAGEVKRSGERGASLAVGLALDLALLLPS